MAFYRRIRVLRNARPVHLGKEQLRKGSGLVMNNTTEKRPLIDTSCFPLNEPNTDE